jgi:hypothetical protein
MLFVKRTQGLKLDKGKLPQLSDYIKIYNLSLYN